MAFAAFDHLIVVVRSYASCPEKSVKKKFLQLTNDFLLPSSPWKLGSWPNRDFAGCPNVEKSITLRNEFDFHERRSSGNKRTLTLLALYQGESHTFHTDKCKPIDAT